MDESIQESLKFINKNLYLYTFGFLEVFEFLKSCVNLEKYTIKLTCTNFISKGGPVFEILLKIWYGASITHEFLTCYVCLLLSDVVGEGRPYAMVH